ncbi:SAM-dependent methyltransferase [Dethiosulfovibrio sp. F2B]|uniref:SAM-dependent methyltransferase n=1 Tax=Dethiosulfovibrio faecalis TaxID=2720018 RepID=UPI001F48E89D|nr:SAM-dependent methyltransferase [Dethiosulfovibrio faecalis]MCF4152523.1 SAM-dependent methyltransferase [Dethiosulfovibrio faecalis]
MKNISLKPIGEIVTSEDYFAIHLNPMFRNGLNGLNGFSHVILLYFFHMVEPEKNDVPIEDRLVCTKPYRKGPERMGVFATRTPLRPNRIGLSSAKIIDIDQKEGILTVDYIDAFSGSPLLDIKPYSPSLDAIENPKVPEWCSHWPSTREESAFFNWDEEM